MTLAFTRTGRRGAPTVVALHGATERGSMWSRVAAHLDDVDVIALDLPGHGSSAHVTAPGVAAALEVIARTLVELGVERAVWAGHSMGGLLAQAASIQRPSLVAGLALVGTRGRFKVPDFMFDAVRADFEAALGHMKRGLFGDAGDPALVDEWADAMRTAGVDGTVQALHTLVSFDARPLLPKIEAPTVVVAGELDELAPLFATRELATQISGAELRVLEGAGHMLLGERPRDVAGAIHDVIARAR